MRQRAHCNIPLGTVDLRFAGGYDARCIMGYRFSRLYRQARLWASYGLLIGTAALIAAGQSPAGSDDHIAYFRDISQQAGLAMITVFGGVDTKKYIIETTGAGVAIFDYDNDGWPDIFFVNGTRLDGSAAGQTRANHLYRNNHDGTFTDVTAKAGLAGPAGWGQGVCVGDYDNDGWDDLYVTYYGKNRLYHNQSGVFTEVAEKAGVAGNGKEWSTGCAFLDYDRDGYLDLVVANYVDFDLASAPAPGERPSCVWKGAPVMCGPRGLPGGKNILYRNRGDGAFENTTRKAHIDKTDGHYCLSVSTLDYDDDGWPDIYVASDSAPSILYHNNRDGTFSDVGVMAGTAFNEDGREQAGMGTSIADYDADGRLDIVKTNFSDDTPTLYRNRGDGTFDDVTVAAGLGVNTQYLGWGVMFFDFDNDGWPDLILANGHVYPEVDKYKLSSTYLEPRVLFHNNGNGKFTDISASAGPGITALAASRGLAVADFWNDGRQSVVINNMNEAPSLLVNQVRSSNHWIALKAVGSRSNRNGIGARIEVKAGQHVLTNEVRSGSSYDSQNDMRVHFGLGSTLKVDWVKVHWPSGLVERFDNLPSDAIHVLREGSGTAVNLGRKSSISGRGAAAQP